MMNKNFLFLIGLLSASCSDKVSEVITVDTHIDINVLNFTDSLNYTMNTDTQFNLPKMIEGGLDVAWLVVYTAQSELNEQGYEAAYENAISKFDAIDRLVNVYAPDQVELALTSDDVRRILAKGKKVIMIGVENAYSMGLDTSNVKKFWDRGARYVSLSHNGHSQFSDSNTGEFDGTSMHNGLSDLGKEVVGLLNYYGIMIDISHPSKEAIRQMAELSKAPIIASHSSVYALCPHYRNLKDDQIKGIAKTGGAVFINFYPGYIDSTFQQKAEIINMKYEVELDILAEKYDSLSNQYWFEEMKLLKHEKARITPSINDVIKHISYIVDLVGVDYVGIGSDYDGVEIMPTGLENVSKLPFLTKKLIEHGYTIREVRKILGGNFKRIFKEVCK